jgi:hypothetical protein
MHRTLRGIDKLFLGRDMFVNKFFRQGCLAVSALAALFLVTIDAQSKREEAFSIDYENVTEDQLIPIYIDAYTKSGFNFLRQTKQTLIARKNPAFMTSVEFEFPVPSYPSKKNGSVIYAVYCDQWRDGSHDSCSIFLKIIFVGGKDYTDEEEAIARAQLRSAHLKAGVIIKEKLGKSFP